MTSFCKVAALVLLSGCAPASLSTTPPALGPAPAAGPVHGVAAPTRARRGIYVGLGGGTSILGYAGDNRRNRAPSCADGPGETDDIAVDANQDLVALVGNSEIIIYGGPQMCGNIAGKIDTNTFALDVASADALNGEIVIANVYDNPLGGVGICTLSAGCTRELSNPNLAGAFGVALAKDGDCWASGRGSESRAVLVYFKRCAGSGEVATGFRTQYPGGLDIDKDGNLVSVDTGNTGGGTGFWVYKGCKPACTLLGGKFYAEGGTEFGHLNADSTQYAGADYQYGQVDVYKYSPTKMTYEYSFNNGMSVNDEVIGAAFVPRSRE